MVSKMLLIHYFSRVMNKVTNQDAQPYFKIYYSNIWLILFKVKDSKRSTMFRKYPILFIEYSKNIQCKAKRSMIHNKINCMIFT